jgi:hypothetical protein
MKCPTLLRVNMWRRMFCPDELRQEDLVTSARLVSRVRIRPFKGDEQCTVRLKLATDPSKNFTWPDEEFSMKFKGCRVFTPFIYLGVFQPLNNLY